MKHLWTTRNVAVFGLVAAMCVAVAGCGGSPGLTKANFDRIKTDGSMSKEDVDKLLGSSGTEVTKDALDKMGGAFAGLGKMLGGMAGGMPDANKMPDMAKVGDIIGKMGDQFGKMAGAMGMKAYQWGDASKGVVCIVMGGRVNNKQSTGLE